MSTYRFSQLFSPQSLAIVGASARDGSLANAVLKNVRAAGFAGAVELVNPRYREINGARCVPTVRDLTKAPDLVIIATPAPAIPAIVKDAGEAGVGAAIILTAGLGHGPGSLADQSETVARKYGLRLLGPNCLGLIVPHTALNASFAARMPKSGDLALISQSGAIAAALAEWGIENEIGFSAIASIGDQLDIDIGDLLDHFALDPRTRAILLYVESIKDARKFMSAARAAARTKPVVVVKAGRHVEGAKAAATHTGALAGSDAVYDAAFRRAGLLRVFDLSELFDAAETLSRVKSFKGNRLAVLTNGGGVGVLAIDRLRDLGGRTADISHETLSRLDAVLPSTWSRANPVDIIGDADPARYLAALDELLTDTENDAVLILNVPTALTSPVEVATAISQAVVAQRTKWVEPKPIFASWIGDNDRASQIFNAAAIPHYPTEAEAIRGFMHLVRYREAAIALMEMPPSLPEQFEADEEAANAVVDKVLTEGRRWLDPLELVALFRAYAVPLVVTVHAATPEAAGRVAAPFFADGMTVALKIFSRDIVHKSDVGGVRLDLVNEPEVVQAATDMIANVRQLKPDARMDGFILQPMIRRPHARELILGIAPDSVFGPVILFGRGGTAVEVINDKALALPPLDMKLAQDLIGRTRVARILAAYRDIPAANQDAIALTLVKIAQMAADIPQIQELDINPLLADETGVLCLDARVAVSAIPAGRHGRAHEHLAIRPYPKQWERRLTLDSDWRIFVRPVRPEDEPLFTDFFKRVSEEDLRLRFFASVKDPNHPFIARLTQIDYARAMAFIAIDEASGELNGVVRLHADANYDTAEYAILLRSDLKGRGLGWKLMELMIEYARAEGLRRIHGQVLRENTIMLRMCRELGFSVEADAEEPELSFVSYSLLAPNG